MEQVNDLGQPPRRILVIRHGALGDFVLSTGPFRAIRSHHLADHITLLTTSPFKELAETSGLFNDVWIDSRPSAFAPWKWFALRRQLRD
ncbi:MAG: ADP-heptose--LPS heptosyltransferase, partial [Alphaproteobacteria bacterium]|nr:ADP-heptose--LPS heptosyltransferase [Alphaproteobacteria bacterium]